MTGQYESSGREHLLRAVATFVHRAQRVPGVVRISLVGSLATPKPDPKDADMLVIVGDDLDLRLLAEVGRKLKGTAQHQNLGADIFLARNDGTYIGRTCSYSECRTRQACRATSCWSGAWLCDDLDLITLPASLIAQPPVDLWPQVVVRADLPEDVRTMLLRGAPA